MGETELIQCQTDAGDGRRVVASIPADYVAERLRAGFEEDGPWAVADGGALRVPASVASRLLPPEPAPKRGRGSAGKAAADAR